MQTETEDLKKQRNKLNPSVGYSIFSGYEIIGSVLCFMWQNVTYLPTEISTQELAHINMWKLEERSQSHNSAHPTFFLFSDSRAGEGAPQKIDHALIGGVVAVVMFAILCALIVLGRYFARHKGNAPAVQSYLIMNAPRSWSVFGCKWRTTGFRIIFFIFFLLVPFL